MPFLLCKMGDRKINWEGTQKIDRVHRVQAQKVTLGKHTRNTTFKNKPTPCYYFQKGTCCQSVMVRSIYMSVQHALHEVNLTHILRKIVVVQK